MAFKLLQNYDEWELVRLLRKEEDSNILKAHEEKGKMMQILGSLLNIFESKRESFDEMINIIDYEQSESKTKDIEEIISETFKRNEFIKLLRKRGK